MINLLDRAYKINNTWLGFHKDITKLMDILKKNLFPAHLIEKIINRYITGTQTIIIPGIPFLPLHLRSTLSYPT